MPAVREIDRDLTLNIDIDAKNSMSLSNYWDNQPIVNVKSVLVEFTPKSDETSWNGIVFFDNGEEWEVNIVEVTSNRENDLGYISL